MAFYKSHRFAYVHDSVLALIGVPELLVAAEKLVLVFLAKHANWNPHAQGGIPATFVSAAQLSRESGYGESSLENALKRVGSESFHEVGKGIVKRAPLCIIREATPDEASKVLENFQARPGRRPTVRVFRHPRYWSLPEWAWEAVRSRVSEKLWSAIGRERGAR